MIERNSCRAAAGRTVTRALSLIFLLVVLLASAKAGQKQLPLTTSSQPAKDLLAQAVQAVETFDNTKAAQLAKQAVQADSNFAIAQMLVAALSPPPQRQPLLDKIKTLAPSASPGEQQYLEAMMLALGTGAENAIPILEKLHKEFPGERRVCMMLGQVCMNTGKFDQAIPYYEKALELDGSTARVYAFLGTCYLLKDNYAKAQELYRISLAKIGTEASPFPPFSV